MKQFHAYHIALELIRALRPLLAKLKRHDRNLEKHAREAGTSAPLNIAEGNRRTGRSRSQHFTYAAGSADEVKAALEVGIAWGYLSEDETKAALELIDRLQAMLYRLTHPR